jgi:hypothetical protein
MSGTLRDVPSQGDSSGDDVEYDDDDDSDGDGDEHRGDDGDDHGDDHDDHDDHVGDDDKVFHNVLAETNKYREVANMIPYLDRTNYLLR